jgi:polyhydroxybutyrate depolymerase
LQPAFIFLGLLAVLFFAGMVTLKFLDRTNGTLISAGERRTYLLYVPKSYDASRPVPLVITLHGFVQWPAHQMHISRWNELAEKQGFIVVYPGGTRFPKRWRTGAAPDRNRDSAADLQFISDLIDKLEKDYNIDPARVYANGLSNGGGMAFLLSCAMADRIAAVGIVAGALPMTLQDCNPSRAVPVMLFHGTADPIVPFDGGRFRKDQALPAIPGWVANLARRDGCNDIPINLPAQGAVSGIQYSGGGCEVIFYTIQGGGHTWPGGKPIPHWIAGQTNMDIDATRTFWEFFQRHPLPGTDRGRD